MALNHFPTELPRDEITIVVNAIRGNSDSHTLRDQIEAGWYVAGYGISFMPESSPFAQSGPFDENVLALHLEDALKSHGDAAALGILPWSIIVPALIELLSQWLRRS